MTTRPAPLLALGVLALVAAAADASSSGHIRLTRDAATVRYPGGSPPPPAEVALGQRLFFDTRLSANDTMSCASCHRPERGFADGERFSVGVSGKRTGRHTPHLYNLAWASLFFWDGRATSLEAQVLGPLSNPDELGLAPSDAVQKLKAVPEYAAGFQQAYPREGLTVRTLARAIAAFERTLVAADAPFDRFAGGDTTALTPGARRGQDLFFGRARCSTCHSGPDFTDGKFHNTGIVGTDLGRAAFDRVGEFQDRPYPFFQMQRAFKTPGLRNVALTAPYFHDGSEATLDAVVRFYSQGGKMKDGAVSLDIRPLQLDETAIGDLVAFLESLTSPCPACASAGPGSDANATRARDDRREGVSHVGGRTND